MSVQIVQQGNGFWLNGVDCALMIQRYNNTAFAGTPYTQIDQQLINFFHNAQTEQDIWLAMNPQSLFIRAYKLQRRNVFTEQTSGNTLWGLRQSILKLPTIVPPFQNIVTAQANIGTIGKAFDQINVIFSQALERRLLPDTSLSKLLHFVKPDSFCIVDSRAKAVMKQWRYPESFHGMGLFLKDLISHPDFEPFQQWIQQYNIQTSGNTSCSFLKTIDKVMYEAGG